MKKESISGLSTMETMVGHHMTQLENFRKGADVPTYLYALDYSAELFASGVTGMLGRFAKIYANTPDSDDCSRVELLYDMTNYYINHFGPVPELLSARDQVHCKLAECALLKAARR